MSLGYLLLPWQLIKLLNNINKVNANMRQELIELKQYLIKKGIHREAYAIDTLPRIEGHCIYDAKSHIEVFYFERGVKFQQKKFSDVEDAISYFKAEVLSDPFSKL